MSMIFDLHSKPTRTAGVAGNCAKCNSRVYQSLAILDDTYNVWAGRCQHCQAINFLSTQHGLRGYTSSSMYLVLPYNEEILANDLPANTPSAGPGGAPTMHGSPLGEICDRVKMWLAEHDKENSDGK